MHKVIKSSLIFLSLVTTPVFAQPEGQQSDLAYIRKELQQLINDNIKYQERFHALVSDMSLKKQTPNATIIICSDSRIDLTSVYENPAGQLFTVRNIGNQMATAYGSVEYGVNHLHTPILLIVGHSGCGAIKAAMTDYSKESVNIKKELDTLHVNQKDTVNQNIMNNINSQVKLAMIDFASLIENKKLIILGMVYDMHNDFKFGFGKLILINLNGEQDPNVLAENPYIKGLQNITLMKSAS